MGTILEGEYDEVMSIVRDCFKELEIDCNRISVNLKMDYRRGSQSRMDSKINKIETLLKRKIKK
jgi:uncharacterized protein YqgV (UPF0045/DUF77 family)